MYRSPAVVALTAMAVVAVVAPSVALAHARLKSSTPGVGEVVPASPAQVSITFTQDIQKVSGTYDIQVTKDRGPSVTSGPAVIDEADRSILSVPLQPNLPAGRYVVAFRNVSDADGDPFACSYAFYVQTLPTAVDQSNDAQLNAGCTAEETPGAGQTAGAATSPGAGQTAAASAPAGSATVAIPETSAAPTPIATPDAPASSGGSNTGRNIGIAVAVVALVVVVGGGGWFAMSRRR